MTTLVANQNTQPNNKTTIKICFFAHLIVSLSCALRYSRSETPNKSKLFLFFRSLNRISELRSKVLTFGNTKQKQAFFCFFAHLIVPLSYALRYSRSEKSNKSKLFFCFFAHLIVPLSHALRYSRSEKSNKIKLFFAFSLT